MDEANFPKVRRSQCIVQWSRQLREASLEAQARAVEVRLEAQEARARFRATLDQFRSARKGSDNSASICSRSSLARR